MSTKARRTPPTKAFRHRSGTTNTLAEPCTPEAVCPSSPGLELHHLDNVPQWLQDNEFIKKGYRVNYKFWDCVRSVFHLHNETGNIWTHLLGFIFFAVLVVYTWQHVHPDRAMTFLVPRLGGNITHVREMLSRENADWLMHDIGERLWEAEDTAYRSLLNMKSSLMDRGETALRSVKDSVSDRLHSLEDNFYSFEDNLVNGGTRAIVGWQESAREFSNFSSSAIEAGGKRFKTMLSEGEQALMQFLSKNKEAVGVLSSWVRGLPVDENKCSVPSQFLENIVTSEAIDDELTRHRMIFTVFLSTAMLCMAFSAIFHTFFCHSPEAYNMTAKMDYAGISLLICGHSFPAVFYFLFCYPQYQMAYWVIQSIFSLIGVAVTFIKKFDQPEYRHVRALTYIGVASVGVLPAIHAAYLNGISDPEFLHHFYHYAGMGAFYLLGVAFYIGRIPERWFPGMFDHWFHSHQIFHVLVVVAAYTHFVGCLHSFQYRLVYGCTRSS